MGWYDHGAGRLHPNSCPMCGTEPYPAGTCEVCGFTRAADAEHEFFSDNNRPALVWAGLCWFLAISAILGLIFKAILD